MIEDFQKNKIPKHFLEKIKEAKEKQLKELDLSNHYTAEEKDKLTTIPQEIFELEHLQILHLNNHSISRLPESFGSLTNLTVLSLKKNQLAFFSEAIDPDKDNLTGSLLEEPQVFSLSKSFNNLINLKVLNLEGNQLTSLPKSFSYLRKLTILNLEENQLTDLPEYFSDFINLSELYLLGNKFKYIPQWLKNLNKLTILTLGQNCLESVPKFIGTFNKLKILSLGKNQLKSIPESISNLDRLEKLYLAGNQLELIPESLYEITTLSELNLGGNQLKSVSKSIGNLTQLEILDLGGNQLKYLPLSLGNLNRLKQLYLGGNKITSLPKSFNNFTNSTEIFLARNPLNNPPIEIAEKGIEAIKEYFRQLEEVGKDRIYEAKVLIIGEVGAGKTTLAKKIVNPDFKIKPTEAKTEGINITRYSFPLDDGYIFKVNIWDFKQEEIYDNLHHFFLTPNALYILVIDNNLQEEDNLYYWLNITKILSNRSPLLIIQNEKYDLQQELDESMLREQFKNIQAILTTNLSNNQGLDIVLGKMKYHLSNLERIENELPTTWIKVSQILERDPRNYISLEEYSKICEVNGIKRNDDKLQLSGYLHDLGVCLHFQSDRESILYKIIIIKPEWAINTIYRVLKDRKIIGDRGYFKSKNLKNIWRDKISSHIREELLELMKKLDLCYCSDRRNTFIVPQLLREKPPEYEWDTLNNLILCYRYPDFMPKGIISRFIVAMHQYIDRQKYVWKNGVILNKNKTKAEVIEYLDRREIRIRLVGEDCRGLSTIICYQLNKINHSYQRLKYHKLIPCNCEFCQKTQNPYTYKFSKLVERLAHGKSTIECGNPPYKDSIPVWNSIDRTLDLKQLAIQHQQDSHKLFNFSDKIEQLLFQLTERGTFSEELKNSIRKIDLQKNNHYQQTTYNQLASNATLYQSKNKDKIAVPKNLTNTDNPEDLTQIAAEITTLIVQLEELYPTDMTYGQIAIAEEIIKSIDRNPKLASKISNLLKVVEASALRPLIDRPAANFTIAALEDWQRSKSDR